MLQLVYQCGHIICFILMYSQRFQINHTLILVSFVILATLCYVLIVYGWFMSPIMIIALIYVITTIATHKWKLQGQILYLVLCTWFNNNIHWKNQRYTQGHQIMLIYTVTLNHLVSWSWLCSWNIGWRLLIITSTVKRSINYSRDIFYWTWRGYMAYVTHVLDTRSVRTRKHSSSH